MPTQSRKVLDAHAPIEITMLTVQSMFDHAQLWVQLVNNEVGVVFLSRRKNHNLKNLTHLGQKRTAVGSYAELLIDRVEVNQCFVQVED